MDSSTERLPIIICSFLLLPTSFVHFSHSLFNTAAGYIVLLAILRSSFPPVFLPRHHGAVLVGSFSYSIQRSAGKCTIIFRTIGGKEI